MHQTKYIVVTGGVISGLGKGIAAASIGHLLSSAGLKVVPMKLDGYLNVDPGTMNPIEHGEVFVLDDGGEVDMDFGHYERFLNIQCKFHWNLTMGKVFHGIWEKERRGDYLGKTVGFIPHVVDFIKEKFFQVAQEEDPDVLLIEVGGTVGDMENELYVEAVRQLKKQVGEDNTLYVHLTYIPILNSVREQKSKPTQQSVALLREHGITPDIIIGRCSVLIDDAIKEKIAISCDVEKEAVITGLDVDSVYKIPLIFHEEDIVNIINKKLKLSVQPSLARWSRLLEHLERPEKEVTIAICGKYTKLEDSYASVVEALRHAAANLRCKANLKWIETTHIENGKLTVEKALENVAGVIVPGGFGARGAEGKIEVVRYCREHNVPYLGLCYGMQLAVIEYARNVCGLHSANSTEIEEKTPHPIIDLLPEQRAVTAKGATMRLGGHDIAIKPDTAAHRMFRDSVRLRFRHRYEVNPEYIEQLQRKGLVFSGTTPDKKIAQILELPNLRFFMATQAHPELTSSLEEPSKFFYDFLKAALGE